MSNEIEKFDFGGNGLRVVSRDGEPWFVAADVCHDDALSLANVTRALSNLDDDEKGLTTVKTPGGDQRVSIISESGLYKLIMRSRKERAKPFVNWVTREVLPTIRKTGGDYNAPGSPVSQAAANGDVDELADLLERNSTALARLSGRVTELTGENDALRPRTVGATGAESRKGGEPVWNLRDAVCDMLGVDTTQMYTQLRLVQAVEQRNNGHYVVKPHWSDLLFNTTNEVDGKSYPVGAPRVRPGKQAEFLARVRDAYTARFGPVGTVDNAGVWPVNFG